MSHWNRRLSFCLLLCLGTGLGGVLADEQPVVPSPQESVEVTATRIPEVPIGIPVSIQLISGEEIERRHATTLGEAIGLAMGVYVAPGGDGGPASSVPEMMGLREFDAFLLVVDDVPWGGAFNPDLATLDLTNVERIEILRGAAPVLYGATSFVGVIHVIHRAAGAGTGEARVSGGIGNPDDKSDINTYGASIWTPLPSAGEWKQSISAGYDQVGYRDDRTSFERGHVLYRGAIDSGSHTFRLDLDATMLNQEPASPHPRLGATLTDLIPIDSNFNPTDSRQDQDRFHLVLGHSMKAMGGDWTTTLAVTSANRRNTKGFLRNDTIEAPPLVADGFRQKVDESDVYFDTHVARHASDEMSFVFGVDELYGKGKMDSDNFEYDMDQFDGSDAPSASGITVDERPHLEDERSFAGLYGQMIWTPVSRFRVEAGARLNVTHEKRQGEVGPGDGGGETEDAGEHSRNDTRGAGSVGVSFRVWEQDFDSVWLFADYRNTFKPAAIDFGPEAEGDILEPENARMTEAGVKGSHADGRFGWEASTFHMDFKNVVVATQVDGLPALENVGEENFDGVEAEASWAFAKDLRVQGSWAYHDAKFGNYLADFDGTLVQLDGNRVEMSAKNLASLGVLYLPQNGFNASVVAQYVGSRFLNKRNTAPADSYTIVSAGIGWRFGKAEVRVDCVNCSDERDPVSESELGDSQYYLVPARSIVGTFDWRFR